MDDVTRPLYAQTQAVLAALDRGAAAALESLATADVSLVDLDAASRPTVLHTLEALREYLGNRGAAAHPSTILAYEGHADRDSGWSVVRFRRDGRAANEPGSRELCSATLLWRLTTVGWKLRRWHCTLERSETAAR